MRQKIDLFLLGLEWEGVGWVMFNGQSFSSGWWKNLGNGDVCIIMWMCLIPLDWMCKKVKMENIMLCIIYHKRKKSKRGKKNVLWSRRRRMSRGLLTAGRTGGRPSTSTVSAGPGMSLQNWLVLRTKSFIPTTPKRRGKRLHPEGEVCLLWLFHPSGFQCMDLSAHHPPPALLAAEGGASGL